MNWTNEPCPYLPVIRRRYSAADMKGFGKDRGPDFYRTALCYAQSHWQSGLPAQSLLQCNRALSAPLSGDEPVLREHPLPYQAMAWLILQPAEGQFIGNPRRHWQHLATRMVEPDKELRVWRAWACWYLAKTLLPEAQFPPDAEQIRNEQVVEPTFGKIFHQLGQVSPADDLATWQHALQWGRQQVGQVQPSPPPPTRIRLATETDLPHIISLAHEIWHQHYPGIISQEQIEYMLDVWYQKEAMSREMRERGVVYALIEVAGGGPVGYLGFEPQPDSEVLFLSKLYLKDEVRGLGVGRAALEWVRAQAKERECRIIRLRVNRANRPAIRSYLRAGFHFVEDLCSDIGKGFVMDDYVLERPVA